MDQKTFEQMAHKLRQKAKETSLGMGTSKQDAEDIAQEVMLRLWQMHEDLERYHSVEAVAATAARRLTLNKKREMALVLPYDREQTDKGTSADPQILLEESEDAQWLDRRIANLPVTQYTILYMRQVEHRSSTEIGKILGIEETSVRTLLARARHTLYEEIKARNK